MTGQVKEQVLARLGDLGLEVVSGRVRFRPRLISESEYIVNASTFAWLDALGTEHTDVLPPRSLAFTYCQVLVVYTLGEQASIELERSDGETEVVRGAELDPAASAALFHRTGRYRRLNVTIPPGPPVD